MDDQGSHLLTAYVDTLMRSAAHLHVWTTHVAVRQVKLLFKLDTSANVTTISEEEFKSLEKVPIHKSTRKLYGSNRTQ